MANDSYAELTNKKDEIFKQWVKHFNQFDLYTKSYVTYDLDELKEYYLPVIEKYLGAGPIYW